MLFALIIERVVWGTIPRAESLFGGALIIAAAIWVSVQKNRPSASQPLPQVDEESSLVAAQDQRD